MSKLDVKIKELIKAIEYDIFSKSKFLQKFYQVGNRKKCSICGYTSWKFHRTNRPDSMCPKCESKERHRTMWEFLKKEGKEIIENGENLLYFSPHKKLLEKIEREIDCVSLDIKHQPSNVKADIHNIPFDNCSFDMVICSHVLPQVRDDRAALEEIHRILDTGGISLLMVQQDEDLAETKEDPSITTKAEKAKEYGLDSRYRLYGNDFINRVSAAGFDVEKVPYADKIPSEVAKRYGLFRNRYYDMDWVPENFRGKPGRAENIYVCKK